MPWSRQYPDWLRKGVVRSAIERHGTFWPGLKTIHSLLDELGVGRRPSETTLRRWWKKDVHAPEPERLLGVDAIALELEPSTAEPEHDSGPAETGQSPTGAPTTTQADSSRTTWEKERAELHRQYRKMQNVTAIAVILLVFVTVAAVLMPRHRH